MNFLKRSALIAAFALTALQTIQAEDVTNLPTIRVMAESELREEVGFVPLQEDKEVRQALQHRIDQTQNATQNINVKENFPLAIDYQPITSSPDLSQFSPFLQQYILAITNGIQSSDPTNGLFEMLRPLNINRNNVDTYREGTMKVNMNDLINLQQQIQDGLKGR
ncbi:MULTISPECIES: hypothetical protein [Acinetobacter]|nr:MULTISPECIES: hypothetical protein [Acinetobacter]ENV52846.1 hypothetical protein F952_03249 [Acinetobacter baylyi DSM 14961 = CIP 107474]KAF2369853.1 peptide signal protein [Acinetobacter baylyi]KAF2375707.1 peptide signal protein [Acinetobacter baylyi]KAF2377266.1 peptide signal protein [Acinetobacter baylyi]KAF2383429.1 peptide signal protein [Acinetobacter baylyi]